MVEFLRKCCMESLLLALDLQEGLSFDTKTFANEIWRQATSTQKAGRLQLQTATVGGSPSKQGSRQAGRREKTCGTPGESADDRIGQQQHLQSQACTCRPVKTATEPVDQESNRTATAGAATQSDINLLAHFPLSSATGYRYIYIYIYASFSSLSTLAWLRWSHICEITWGGYMVLPPS